MSQSTSVPRPSTVQYPAPVRLAVRCPALLCASAIALISAGGCEPPDSTSGQGGGAGTSSVTGGAGGCLMTPKPSFALKVLVSKGGPVPPDTTVEVRWSAGEEPPFRLDDPKTWGTLETANVVCDVDHDKPPPEDLPALTCSLWTSGPTEVTVSAKGFVTKDRTFTQDPSTDCSPDPTPIEVELDASTNAP